MGASGVKFLPGGFTGGEAVGWKAMIDVLRKLCHGTAKAGVDLLMHTTGIIRRRRQIPLAEPTRGLSLVAITTLKHGR